MLKHTLPPFASLHPLSIAPGTPRRSSSPEPVAPGRVFIEEADPLQGSCALALKAALYLAPSGLALFPCGYSKRPTCEHGLLDATTDATVLRKLWRRHGGELVAVRTGAVSGV